MRKTISLLLAFITMVSLCACQENFGSVNLKDSIEIPENGIIREGILQQIKDENAIGVFIGKSGDYKYEWTVFGSDISEPKEINLGVQLTETAEGDVKVVPNQTEAFGFSALLSIYLNQKWDAQSVTAYANNTAAASVSVTGSKTTVLNLTLDGSVEELVIRADSILEDKTVSAEETTVPATQQDAYLSKPQNGSDQTYTGGVDKYNTDPVPAGKPQPVEPEDQEVDKSNTLQCTFSIECSTILNNLGILDPEKLEMVPSSGIILPKTTVTFYEGESVFDVLQRLCKEKGIHLESSWTPIYNSAYIEGIHNLYEFDCGDLSGWMYKVNGWYPNYGCSRYQLKDGDTVEWRYTCDMGNDIGGGYAVGG